MKQDDVSVEWLPQWSWAEFFDTPFADRGVLRATIYRLGEGMWEWSVTWRDSHRSELISIGTESRRDLVRRVVAEEVEKCLCDELSRDPETPAASELADRGGKPTPLADIARSSDPTPS